jgi:hypothetical protein
VLRKLKVKNALKGKFSRAAPYNHNLRRSKIADRVILRWFLMIAIEISMDTAPEQVFW